MSSTPTETRREALKRGRFSSFQKTLVYLGGGGSLVTGFGLFVIRYFMEAGDDFSVYHTPSEPWWALTHKLGSPVLIFAFGLIWLTHIKPHYRSPLPKFSGVMAVSFLGLMILSGYSLDFFAGEMLARSVQWTHTGSGLAFSICFLVHAFLGIRIKKLENIDS